MTTIAASSRYIIEPVNPGAPSVIESKSDFVLMWIAGIAKPWKPLLTFLKKDNISWRDIEALFIELGADVSEGSGSRVRVALNGVRAVFHRPHPQKEARKGAVKSVRKFLEAAGVQP